VRTMGERCARLYQEALGGARAGAAA